ncbi:MAG: sigma-54 dependent transcriptional regulator [Desulfobulbaceae bacterium]|nr:sigma-54 dependent transcriptional regulator [Desulfobulbaceae bacterium]
MTASGQKILVADDEQNMRIALYEALSRNGYDVSVAENGQMALEMVEKSPPDMLITDIKMPTLDGIELLRRIKSLQPSMPVVIITGFATVDTAVEAMKQGAVDYIIKPFSVEVIEETVARVFAAGVSLPALAGANTAVKAGAREESATSRPVIGKDEQLLKLLAKAKSVASSKATVLILGESGTGKEVFARYLHEQSDRHDAPFVALNCAALPEGLLESELFGHEKGAFTGAIATKKGKFELADGGTLLLDEIGEVPLHLQAKLLRVLQEEEVDRLGGKAPVKVDVHVLATTNRDLKEAAAAGEFRQDLYYRLNVIPLRLPPLRERSTDIPLLAEYFIEKYSSRYNKPVKPLSKASHELFMNNSWPGNVREMENLVERAVLLSAGDELEPWDFWDDVEMPQLGDDPVAVAGNTSGGESPVEHSGEVQSLRDVERQMIMQALQKTDDNRTHAAKMLGISVRTLRNKLQEYREQGHLS